MTKNILVIGDSCRDIYTYCSSDRLAPDKPVPVLEVEGLDMVPGMAMNVFRNLQALKPGNEIVTNSNWKEVTKNRYVDEKSNHMFMRVDHKEPVERVNLADIEWDYNYVVISDYDKGFLTEEDIEVICSSHPYVFLDTKKVLGDWAKNARFIKINQHEYQRSLHWIEGAYGNIIETRGAAGCVYANRIYPVRKKVEVLDVSGAGDAFLAGLVMKYSEDKNIHSAINFANRCASSVVQQRGTTTIQL